MLSHPNAFHARLAQRLLHERKVTGTLDKEGVGKALAEFEDANASETSSRLRALWTRSVTGLLPEEMIIAGLGDPDEHYRAWSVQLCGDTPSPAVL